MAERIIYARAQNESVQLTEIYSYSQEISGNPSITKGQKPSGEIKIVVPFDGHQYFTLQACKDVQQQMGTSTGHATKK